MVLASLTLVSCQKAQEEVIEESVENEFDEGNISAQAAGNTIRGLISKEAAERMGEKFHETYKTKNASQYIAFSTKDLRNYMDLLKRKYKSDSVYVSFGVYDEKTAVKKSDIGRVTVFFMGKNKNKKTGNIKSQAANDVLDEGSNYFNHGNIWP
ncbi:MAG: hypothetical protein EAZ12_02530 [Sphingobacteriia bacterium]|nr:MAG: hypothetical protein EAZ12_02530 [Sphingobacteriia bacterium]